MFFYIYKTIILLVHPFTFFLFFNFYLSLKLPSSYLRLCLRIFLAFIFTLSLSFFSNVLIKPLETRYPYIPIKNIPQADVTLVLSGMLYTSKQETSLIEFTSHVDRILFSQELIRSKKSRFLMISGGSGSIFAHEIPEAVQLRNWLIGRGLDSKFIWTEGASRNTRENAFHSVKFLISQKEVAIKKILLVTSAFHLTRSVLALEQAKKKIKKILENKLLNVNRDMSENDKITSIERLQRELKNIEFEIVPLPCDYQAPALTSWPEALVPNLRSFELSLLALKEYLGIGVYYFYEFLFY